jgi:hypothetical protein
LEFVLFLFFSSYLCDSFYSWFTIFAFFELGVIHESTADFHRLQYSMDLPDRFCEQGTTQPVRSHIPTVKAVKMDGSRTEVVVFAAPSCLLQSKVFVPRMSGL